MVNLNTNQDSQHATINDGFDDKLKCQTAIGIERKPSLAEKIAPIQVINEKDTKAISTTNQINL